jgi:hypothetical protein
MAWRLNCNIHNYLIIRALYYMNQAFQICLALGSPREGTCIRTSDDRVYLFSELHYTYSHRWYCNCLMLPVANNVLTYLPTYCECSVLWHLGILYLNLWSVCKTAWPYVFDLRLLCLVHSKGYGLLLNLVAFQIPLVKFSKVWQWPTSIFIISVYK